MPRIDQKIDPGVLRIMRDTVAAVLDRDVWRPPDHLPEDDVDLAEFWVADLRESHDEDLAALRVVVGDPRLGSGIVEFADQLAESAARACSTVRLYLRRTSLARIPDEVLESGGLDVRRLHLEQRRLYLGYVFLGLLQELLVTALDPAAGEPG